MIDFLVFLFQQFGNLILWFDTIPIYGSLTFLRLFLIIVMIVFVFKIVGGKND